MGNSAFFKWARSKKNSTGKILNPKKNRLQNKI